MQLDTFGTVGASDCLAKLLNIKIHTIFLPLKRTSMPSNYRTVEGKKTRSRYRNLHHTNYVGLLQGNYWAQTFYYGT